MQRKPLLIIFLCLTAVLPSRGQSYADTVLQRYRQFLFAMEKPAGVPQLAAAYNSALQQWPDVDYHDVQPANWKVSRHLEKTRNLAIAWANPASPHYHDTLLWRIVNGALDHWLAKRYKSVNWWHNKIGVPRYMRDILALLHDTLQPQQLAGALAVMAQNDAPSYRKSTGANLVWCADLDLHYGALTHNEALMRSCATLIWNEVKITTAEGIQPDYSFHQHGPRLQTFQYGGAFLRENIRLAWQLRGTPWACPAGKAQLLASFLLEGWQWMARGIHTVPGTLDRAASRPGTLEGADIRPLMPYLYELYPAQAAAFRAMARTQEGGAQTLRGFRYFPCSDFTAYQQPGFTFFLKTISERTLPAESINNENLQGQLMNSGDAYLVQNGKEYYNLMPVWNWRQLPGVTAFKNAAGIQRHAFAGGVGNGSCGFTAMRYGLQGSGEQTLQAKKMWACYGNTVVCLVTDIQQTGTDSIYTTLDQCRQQGPVRVSGRPQPVRGEQVLHQVQWIQQGSFAYLFPRPLTVQVRAGSASGSWQSINASGPAGAVKEQVFSAVLLHGATPAPQPFTYVLAPCRNAAEASRFIKKPVWRLLRNDSACQAVAFGKKTIMAAFYTAGVLQAKHSVISASAPCLLLADARHIYVCDPSRKTTQLTLTINRQPYTIQLPRNGTAAMLPLHQKN